MYKNFLKRGFDIIVSSVVLLIFSPVIVLIAFFVWIDFSENPFFIQKRPGINEKIFKLIKFKSMHNFKDHAGLLLPDQLRLTLLGKFLRKTSLDELPQLINVLKGDMSLIGPRPLLPRYLPYYYPEERKRHLVRPGISGWAQVNGRNSVGWEKRLEMDVYYVSNLSFKLDILILLKTVRNVIFATDVIIDNNFDFYDLDVERKFNHLKLQET